MTEKETLHIGERLMIERRRQGLTQDDLAQKADTTAAAISMIENGRRNPSLRLAREIAGALDVSLDWLADGDRP